MKPYQVIIHLQATGANVVNKLHQACDSLCDSIIAWSRFLEHEPGHGVQIDKNSISWSVLDVEQKATLHKYSMLRPLLIQSIRSLLGERYLKACDRVSLNPYIAELGNNVEKLDDFDLVTMYRILIKIDTLEELYSEREVKVNVTDIHKLAKIIPQA